MKEKVCWEQLNESKLCFLRLRERGLGRKLLGKQIEKMEALYDFRPWNSGIKKIPNQKEASKTN